MDKKLVYIVPTRGRPSNVIRLIDAFGRLSTYPHIELIFGLDEDDDTAHHVRDIVNTMTDRRFQTVTLPRTSKGMVGPFNIIANAVVRRSNVYAIGFMGDDHLPETHGWDTRYMEALASGAEVVHGNDGIWGASLPTQCAFRADIVRALGYAAPPMLVHLFVDNFWRDLAAALGGLVYLADVTVRHLHPMTGATEWDEVYVDANANHADGDRYRQFVNSGQLAQAVHTVATYQRGHES